MMFLKKNKETMKKGKSREKYASKETFKSPAYSNVPYKKKKCFATLFSIEPAFLCSQFLDQYQLKNIKLLSIKKHDYLPSSILLDRASSKAFFV